MKQKRGHHHLRSAPPIFFLIFNALFHLLDTTHQDFIDELEDGLAGSASSDVLDDNAHAFIRGGVNLREKSAVEGLLALSNAIEE